ncbi:MAG TPA: alpha/beta hydrolase [Chitinophagales bacterium]|nr:alpha/beta hydrolase [Chitinophagales bacterium]
MIEHERNVILQSPHGRPFLADVYYLNNGKPKPVVILSHGFKGFKDWGPFDLIAERFAQAGFVIVKFNFSHNGTTIDHPVDFVDLEAFGNDNITIELDDLGVVVNWVCATNFPVKNGNANLDEICLIGHSRGGGISILKAREDKRIKRLCTWASLSEVGKYWTKEQLAKIKEDGVVFLPNTRTQQMMPIKWQMYENYFANLDRLFVPDALRQLQIPLLIIHGTKDETVPVENAIEMETWNKNARLLLIAGGNHNFSSRHPWTKTELPPDFEKVVDATIRFFHELPENTASKN